MLAQRIKKTMNSLHKTLTFTRLCCSMLMPEEIKDTQVHLYHKRITIHFFKGPLHGIITRMWVDEYWIGGGVYGLDGGGGGLHLAKI